MRRSTFCNEVQARSRVLCPSCLVEQEWSPSDMSIPIVDLAGTPGERGLTHGRALADGIDRFYERWMLNASAGPRPIAERDAVAFALGLLPESRSQSPDLVEEVEGIAEGAGLRSRKSGSSTASTRPAATGCTRGSTRARPARPSPLPAAAPSIMRPTSVRAGTLTTGTNRSCCASRRGMTSSAP